MTIVSFLFHLEDCICLRSLSLLCEILTNRVKSRAVDEVSLRMLFLFRAEVPE